LVSEGDHIKVTASKFPFPTVCADKQSTDWFHAISRTLKWNERERQKSFVVVEEGPAKEKPKHHQRKNHLEPTVPVSKGNEEEDEEGDDDNSDEEEEKYDIDDLSSENSDAAPSTGNSTDSGIDSSSRTSPTSAAASRAAEAIMGVSPGTHAKARSRSRSGTRSGVDSPNRFAPVVSRQGQGHVQWAASVPGDAKDKSSQADGGLGDIRTPTAAEHARRTRSPATHSHQHPHAFAVWGQDESDSNSSDNDP
jgi:NAD+ kinase